MMMKSLILLLLVQQSLTCCLPGRFTISAMQEVRTVPRSYNHLLISNDDNLGRMNMEMRSSTGMSMNAHININNRTMYIYSAGSCVVRQLSQKELNTFTKAKCLPDTGVINYQQSITLAGNVAARIVSGNFTNESGQQRFDAVIAAGCVPVIYRDSADQPESLWIYGNFSSITSPSSLSPPAQCLAAGGSSGAKRSVRGPFGHLLNL